MAKCSRSWTFLTLFLCGFLFGNGNCAREGFGPGLQDWGFETVREGAHMFWWLFYTTADVAEPTDRPLAIWLQGGPGASSTGYGNFEELGPLDLDLNPRNHTWVNDMNVLFIDNPVGSGFSYVDDVQYLTTDNLQIANDLVELMKQFYEKLPQFKTVPLHIFSESYGGKMAPEFAYVLYNEIQLGNIECNLKSVSLGDPWVSPIDSVLSWAPFLLNMGAVDRDGYNDVMTAARETEVALNNGQYYDATVLWGYTEYVIVNATHGVDFYNVLLRTPYPPVARKLEDFKRLRTTPIYGPSINFDERDNRLEYIMRGPVSEALEIPPHVVWGSQSDDTFYTLATDFMKPVTHIVEQLLNTTDLHVVVFTGQLDLIVATPGTIEWIDRLEWPGVVGYREAPRLGIGVDNILEGYSKRYGNFSVFWVNRAGHMVPNDNPAAMGHILRAVTNYG